MVDFVRLRRSSNARISIFRRAKATTQSSLPARSPVLDYEVPALAALGSSNRANPFSVRAAAFAFPEAKRPGLTSILAEVPLSSIQFTTDKEKKTYSADLIVVAALRDESGQVAAKMSQRYALNGPAAGLEAAAKGEVLFFREAELPAGKYRLEAVAYDGIAKKASVGSVNLDLPLSDETKLRMSSVMFLKRAERLSEQERRRDNPFHFGEVIVYPNLGNPVRKSTTKQLAFAFTAWPAAGSTEKLTMTLEIFQNGASKGKIAGDLPAADESGRVKYASALPLDGFPPGSYEMKVTVRQGAASTSNSRSFTVEP